MLSELGSLHEACAKIFWCVDEVLLKEFLYTLAFCREVVPKWYLFGCRAVQSFKGERKVIVVAVVELPFDGTNFREPKHVVFESIMREQFSSVVVVTFDRDRRARWFANGFGFHYHGGEFVVEQFSVRLFHRGGDALPVGDGPNADA